MRVHWGIRAGCLLLLALLWQGCTLLTQLGLFGEPGAKAPEDISGKSAALEMFLERKRQEDDVTALAQQYVAVLPFVDESGFRREVWDIQEEMPRLFSLRMVTQPDWRIVPYEVVEEVLGGRKKFDTEQALAAGRRMEADILLLGVLTDYDMKRVSVGDPLLGGYKSYTGVAEIDLRVLRVADGSDMGSVVSRQEPIDRGLGLDLLGKPREQDLQFTQLDKIDFGSTEFAATVIGQATLAAMDDLAVQLAEMLKPSGLKLGGQPAEILSVYGDEVFINLGSDNGLRLGYRFVVFPGPERVDPAAGESPRRLGIVEVIDIIGGHISKVSILQRYGEIAAGDRLRLLGQEQENSD